MQHENILLVIIFNGDVEINKPDKELLLYENIKDAVQTLKKHPGSRMKTFPNKEDAKAFADAGCTPVKSKNPSNLTQIDFSPSLKKPNLPAPTPKELTKLRILIQNNDKTGFKELVYANPRYLISVCDTAVRLMAGPKWNACHIAVRNKHPDMLNLILRTVSDVKFVRSLYPVDPASTIQESTAHLLDSYLNTPEPAKGWTPLHTACRNGDHKIIKILLSYESLDRTLKDCDGLTARESILLPILNDFKEDEKMDKYEETLVQKELIDELFEQTVPEHEISIEETSELLDALKL